MTWGRLIVATLGVLLYLRSPIDLVPDRLGLVGLLDDLVLLIIAAWWLWSHLRRSAAARPTPPQPSANTGHDWDPHAVLGVSRNASAVEITHAYREQMKRYHPDRVADLGTELQQLAHRKAIEIQRAYSELAAK